jgi:hypothetical protein
VSFEINPNDSDEAAMLYERSGSRYLCISSTTKSNSRAPFPVQEVTPPITTLSPLPLLSPLWRKPRAPVAFTPGPGTSDRGLLPGSASGSCSLPHTPQTLNPPARWPEHCRRSAPLCSFRAFPSRFLGKDHMPEEESADVFAQPISH